MRRHLFRLALAFVVVFALATSMAMSQARQVVTTNVPFSFDIGALTMPAGTYVVQLNNPAGTILIRNTTGTTGAFVFVNRLTPREVNKLRPAMVFNKYESHYFLAKIYGTEGVGCAISKGKLEKELEAKAPTPTQTINIAMEKR